MNEELKMIIEMLTSAGEGVMYGFFVYLSYKIVCLCICFSGVLLIITKGVKVLLDAIYNYSKDGKMLRDIRDGLNIGSQGTLINSERRRMRIELPNILKMYAQLKAKGEL